MRGLNAVECCQPLLGGCRVGVQLHATVLHVFLLSKTENLNPLIFLKYTKLPPLLLACFIVRLFSSHLRRDISSQELQSKLPFHIQRNMMLLGKVGVNLTLGIAGTIGLEGAFWFIKLVVCC